jgi:hypothetical protein
VSKKANITNRRTIQIEWGDYDPDQIVHCPRYLACVGNPSLTDCGRVAR